MWLHRALKQNSLCKLHLNFVNKFSFDISLHPGFWNHFILIFQITCLTKAKLICKYVLPEAISSILEATEPNRSNWRFLYEWLEKSKRNWGKLENIFHLKFSECLRIRCFLKMSQITGGSITAFKNFLSLSPSLTLRMISYQNSQMKSIKKWIIEFKYRLQKPSLNPVDCVQLIRISIQVHKADILTEKMILLKF